MVYIVVQDLSLPDSIVSMYFAKSNIFGFSKIWNQVKMYLVERRGSMWYIQWTLKTCYIYSSFKRQESSNQIPLQHRQNKHHWGPHDCSPSHRWSFEACQSSWAVQVVLASGCMISTLKGPCAFSVPLGKYGKSKSYSILGRFWLRSFFSKLKEELVLFGSRL